MTDVDKVISAARTELGRPYVYGAAGPSTFDCSGLITYIFARVGISLPHNAAEQQRSSKVAKVSNPQPGDLVFYGYPAHHVALYIGNGQQIAAPHTGANVQVQSVSSDATYGRVTGLGVGTIPVVGPAVSGLENVGLTGLTGSFDVDGFFHKVEGTSINLAVASLGLAMIGGGIYLAVSGKLGAALKNVPIVGG